MTSSSLSKRKRHATGPKISSRAMVWSSRTSANTLGATKQPSDPTRCPPVSSRAPSFFPVSMYPRTLSICWVSTCGPWSTCPKGSPTRRSWAALTNLLANSSYTSLWTKMRVPAQQTWPWLAKTPIAAQATASSRSASPKMIVGDLPPSSNVTFFRFVSAAMVWIRRPVAVEPVKATLWTPGCRASAAPTVGPKPETRLKTPLGSPVSAHSCANRRALSGVFSEDLRMKVFPQARAGATFHASVSRG
mmetsp:Transcript_27102/g.48884  ORF Transcript_27102/g.48884 Transcript_27102/m.48884 type:complete len:247 (-) Transcript_27102:502-1242(-)